MQVALSRRGLQTERVDDLEQRTKAYGFRELLDEIAEQEAEEERARAAPQWRWWDTAIWAGLVVLLAGIAVDIWLI